jgi:hypothetical protein
MSLRSEDHVVMVSVRQGGELEEDFPSAAAAFVDALKDVDVLDVDVPQQPEPDARGFITLLTGIIVTGSKIGAFKGIYTLAKDLFDRSRTAEVELKFRDGSVLKLKGLTQQQAEERIERHLRAPTSSKA